MGSKVIKNHDSRVWRRYAKVDLHGMTQAQAFDRLQQIVPYLCQQNYSHIHIITGIGGNVLRTHVPRWLDSHNFNTYIKIVELYDDGVLVKCISRCP
jgi:DNA-nicking Smr family endonuclease